MSLPAARLEGRARRQAGRQPALPQPWPAADDDRPSSSCRSTLAPPPTKLAPRPGWPLSRSASSSRPSRSARATRTRSATCVRLSLSPSHRPPLPSLVFLADGRPARPSVCERGLRAARLLSGRARALGSSSPPFLPPLLQVKTRARARANLPRPSPPVRFPLLQQAVSDAIVRSHPAPTCRLGRTGGRSVVHGGPPPSPRFFERSIR